MNKKIFPILALLLFISLYSFSATLKTEFQNTQPKYIKNPNGTYSGLCVELMQLIENNSEYNFNYEKNFIPSKRIKSNLAKGITDVHFGLSRNSDREKIYIYGEALYEVSYIAISNANDSIEVNNTDDLQGNKILALAGVGFNKYLKDDLKLNIDTSSQTLDASLQMLMAKRGRFFIYHNLGLLYKIKENKYSNKFKVQPHKLKTSQHWIVFSKDTSHEIVEGINQVIRDLKKSGKWEKVTKKYLN